jgi:hypothetical protein
MALSKVRFCGEKRKKGGGKEVGGKEGKWGKMNWKEGLKGVSYL